MPKTEKKPKTESVEKETKRTQWHPAFCSAVQLEFYDNKDDLDFKTEHSINTKPLIMDMLIIRKTRDVELKNDIGEIFRDYNIMEYKSPSDKMNIDTYFKVMSYAGLYKTQGDGVDAIKSDSITITFVRFEKPKELFRKLELLGMRIEGRKNGIHDIVGNPFFPAQIVVSSELDSDEHEWLTVLTKNIERERAIRLLRNTEKRDIKDYKEFAKSVVEVVLKANRNMFNKMEEDNIMLEELRQFFGVDRLEKEIEEKDSALAEKDSALAEKDSALAEKDSAIAEKDAELSNSRAEILRLRKLLLAAGVTSF